MPFGPPEARVVRVMSQMGREYPKVEIMCGGLRITSQCYSLSVRKLVRIKVVDLSIKHPVVNVTITEEGMAEFERITNGQAVHHDSASGCEHTGRDPGWDEGDGSGE
jgi:hypothetical protein